MRMNMKNPRIISSVEIGNVWYNLHIKMLSSSRPVSNKHQAARMPCHHARNKCKTSTYSTDPHALRIHVRTPIAMQLSLLLKSFSPRYCCWSWRKQSRRPACKQARTLRRDKPDGFVQTRAHTCTRCTCTTPVSFELFAWEDISQVFFFTSFSAGNTWL
jgi:hypothetical protein